MEWRLVCGLNEANCADKQYLDVWLSSKYLWFALTEQNLPNQKEYKFLASHNLIFSNICLVMMQIKNVLTYLFITGILQLCRLIHSH